MKDENNFFNTKNIEITFNSWGFETSEELSNDTLEDVIITPEYKYIKKLLDEGGPIVFVTGKAGTGKSTFIRYIRHVTNKNVVVLAPTGVAALNAKGSTIHSFFQFPPRIITDEDISSVYDRRLYQNLDIIIIDEVSMVRADLMDGIDKFLRKNGKDENLPFGGVQLVLIGDLFQLPPVVKYNERDTLKSMGYENPYFFSSKVLKKNKMVTVELNKIYRQKDERFTEILNYIRVGENLNEVLPVINSRLNKELEFKGESAVTLTSTNSVADEINDDELNKLDGVKKTYTAKITGQFEFDEKRLPSPLSLGLKINAQVMFTKNGQFWVNGTLGRIVSLEEDNIKVEILTDNNKSIVDVVLAKWESFSYEFDRIENRIKPVVTGTYEQFPLMLSWAITIHKSQGKTIDKIKIDLGNGAFAEGQVYVALSRVRSITDISLVRKIKFSDIKCDNRVKNFCRNISFLQQNIATYILEMELNESKSGDSQCPNCHKKLVYKHRHSGIFLECTKCDYRREINLGSV